MDVTIGELLGYLSEKSNDELSVTDKQQLKRIVQDISISVLSLYPNRYNSRSSKYIGLKQYLDLVSIADYKYFDGTPCLVNLAESVVLHYSKMDLEYTISELKKYYIKNNHNYMIDLLEQILFPGADKYHEEDKSELENELNCYTYIPYNTHRFVRDLLRITRKFSIHSFMDCGCGIGVKPLFAKLFGVDKSFGIEINEHSYQVGKYFYGRINYPSMWKNIFSFDSKLPTLFNENAFEHDFSKYDLIYTYMPIKKEDSLIKLYEHIFSTMEIGAYMWEIEPTFWNGWLIKKFKKEYYEIPVIRKSGKNKIDVVEIIRD